MSNTGYNQVIHYNRTYDYNNLGKTDLFREGLVSYDSIAVVCGRVDFQYLTHTFININTGNVLYSSIFGDSTHIYYTGGGSHCAINKNSIYTVNAVQDLNTDTTSCFLIKQDKSGSVIFLKTYLPIGYHCTFYALLIKNDTLYAIGFAQYNLTNVDGLLAVLDTNGNLLDYKTYGGSNFDVFNSIDTTTDGGFILGGYTDSYGTGLPPYADAYIVKVDNSLTQQWYKTFGNTGVWEYCYAKTLKTGEYLVYGNNNIPTNNYRDPWVAKLDSVGSIIWEYRHIPEEAENYSPFSTKSFYVLDAVELENGNIALLYYYQEIVGHSMSGYVITNPIGMFQLLNVNGDTLYSRKLKVRNNDNYATRMITTEDGGFLISGFVFADDTSNTQDGWLIKLDSNYCEVDSCIGYQHPNPIPIPKPIMFTNGDWLFYPNPSTAGFTIVPPQSMVLLDNYTVYVYNYLGQQIVSTKSMSWAFIETGTWASGLYIVRILDSNNKDLYCGKVVVNK